MSSSIGGRSLFLLYVRRAETLLKPQNDLMDFLASQVEKRKSDIAQGLHSLEGEGNDFVDAFLIQMEKNRKLGVASSFDDESLTHTLLDLWAAGQETTATTLKWAFAYLLMYPEFDPERYMKGQKLEEQVIPFGIGRRACLGESLARAELYLVSSLPILRPVSLIN
ncbi:hypothetical protein COOONC_10427 [Cooperia oncophora]